MSYAEQETSTRTLQPSSGGFVELMLQVHSLDQGSMLVLHGNLICGAESEALQAAIQHLLAAPGCDRVVVDLRNVAKVDCAGLGVLADAALRARQSGKCLELGSVSRRVREMLRMTRLDSILLGEAARLQTSAA